MPEDPKAMTLRLAREQAEELEAIAEVEERPIADVVRTAIAEHIESRRNNQAFQKKLRAKLERNKRILEQLKKR
jgi:predicted transcriptional regulator